VLQLNRSTLYFWPFTGFQKKNPIFYGNLYCVKQNMAPRKDLYLFSSWHFNCFHTECSFSRWCLLLQPIWILYVCVPSFPTASLPSPYSFISINIYFFWEANRFATSHEIPRILGNPKVHYRIHNCSPQCIYRYIYMLVVLCKKPKNEI